MKIIALCLLITLSGCGFGCALPNANRTCPSIIDYGSV